MKTKWEKVGLWLPRIVILLLPFYLFHMERQWKLFRNKFDAHEKLMELIYTATGDSSVHLPPQLRPIPFAEKTGLVLGNKRVKIRGVKSPYNASLVKKRGGEGYLLFFRYDSLDEDAVSGYTTHIGCAELNANFDQTRKDLITIAVDSEYAEDPRSLWVKDKLLLVYNDFATKNGSENRRLMCAGEVDLSSGTLKNVIRFDPSLQRLEKNWVPFEYEDENGHSDLCFEYSIAPLKVMKVTHDGSNPLFHFPSVLHEGFQNRYWEKIWGIVRGGTPAQKVGDEYLAFFHSFFKERNVPWYCMGAYTFEAKPPFRITGVSDFPILFEGIYDSPPLNTANPNKRVIFPCGFTVDECEGREVIHLSCGENDSAIKIVTLDKEVLLQGLRRIKLKKI